MALAVPQAAHALPAVKLSGDVRLRLEDDWNSHTAAGVPRPDRGRMRVRARFGAAMDLGGGFTLAGRVRTGVKGSQQMSNVTLLDFNRNPVDKVAVTAERFSLAWKGKAATAEIGKMAFPFFTSNEYFWDADISPLGAAGSVTVAGESAIKVRLVGGGFALPVGLASYSGHLYAGQAIVESKRLTLAGGIFRFAADRVDPDRLVLLDGNGSRDYTIVAVNGALRLAAAGKPLTLTGDLYRNLVSYRASSDPISRAYAGQRTGYVVGAAWGDVAKARHLQIGYRYFHVERLAVNSSYSHDDVSRLGTSSQALLSDLKGHDVYANYALSSHWTVGVRAMVTRRITNPEDDDRARLDVSWAF